MSVFSDTRTSMLSDIARQFIACISSPNLWHIPSRSQLLQRLSTATDGYCRRLAVHMESVVAMFGFKRTGSWTMPGAYPLGGMPNSSNEREVNNSCYISDYMKYNDIESGRVVLGTEWMFGTQVLRTIECAEPVVMLELDCLCLPASEIVGAVGEDSGLTVKVTSTSSQTEKHERAPCVSVSNSDVKVFTTTPSQTSALISGHRADATQEGIRKHAGMRTLMLPGRQLRPRKAPTESELALRQIDEELAIEASQRDEYCARELASRGIFMHPPAAKVHSNEMASRRTFRQIWRETSVGPMRPCWSARNDSDVPTIRVIRPEDIQVQKAIARSGPSTGRFLSTSATTPSRQGRARSNAVYVPSKAPVITRPAPAHLSPKEPVVTPLVHKAPWDLEVCRSKKRTSMSDWLDAISTGSNPLVAEDVAIRGRPVLRASLIHFPGSTPPLSPTESTSSLDSSAPSTPVNEPYLPSALVKKRMEVMTASSGQRGARCSYLGHGFVNVVAAVIPEELLTDEIGVAC